MLGPTTNKNSRASEDRLGHTNTVHTVHTRLNIQYNILFIKSNC